MKHTVATITLVAAILLGAAPSQGALVPKPTSSDPHIQTVEYDPDQVVQFQGTLGYQALIEFASDERIENVAIGDSLGWQITPNRKANLLFVKPMEQVPVTNMTVVTNLRRYAFELNVKPRRSANDKTILFSLRFQYPEPAAGSVAAQTPEETPPPQVVNAAYSYEGSTKTVPTRIFDDGKATYFQFRDGEEYPAIFSVDADGGEVIVNSYNRSNYIVVDMIARGYVLRQGSEVTRIYNDGFKETQPGPQSPKPRPKSCWFCR